MAGHVFHGGAKLDSSRIGVNSNRSRKLNSGLRVCRAGKVHLTFGLFRNLSKCVRTIIKHVRSSCPMLFVIVALRQRPELVASIVEPFVGCRWHVLACIFRVDEQVSVACECDLHQSAAILWHDNQLYPTVRHLLRRPAFVIHSLNVTTSGSHGRTMCLSMGQF